MRRLLCYFLRAETARLNTLSAAATIAVSWRGNAIAEVRAGHRSLDSFGAARPVALSWANRHVKRSGHRRHQLRSRLAVVARLQSIRITETARLHLLDRRIHRRRHRTALKVARVNQHRPRAASLQHRRSKIVRSDNL